MKTEQLTKKEALNDYAKLLIDNGYRIAVPKKPSTYLIFSKDDFIGYVQLDDIYGFCFSTIHKPNRNTGTGFSMAREVWEPTEEHARMTFAMAPNWYNKLEHVKKYENLEDYIKHNEWAEYQIIN